MLPESLCEICKGSYNLVAHVTLIRFLCCHSENERQSADELPGILSVHLGEEDFGNEETFQW